MGCDNESGPPSPPSTDRDYPQACRRSSLYRLRVDGREVSVLHTEIADFACFQCEGEFEAEVELLTSETVEEALVRPLSREVEASAHCQRVAFTLVEPANVSVDVSGLKPLYLFASPPDPDPPSPGDPKVHYFPGGQVHEVGELHLQSEETLYIEGGAVVKGAVRATDAEHVAIRGRGILDGSYYRRDADRRRTALFHGCEDVTVEGVTMIRPSAWTLVFELCRDVRVKNVKQITWGHGSDGIDVVSSSDVLVEGCFLRNGDDCVVVKARAPEDFPDRNTDVDNVVVRDCVIANWGCGNAFEIGHELRTPSVGNITFRNCDVLSVEGYGAAFSIHNSDRALVHDVLYEDIRVEHYFTFLIDFRVLHSRWSRDDRRGRIRDVRLKDIRVRQSIYNPGYSISIIGGRDREHAVEGVTLEDIYLDGEKATSADDLDLYARHASRIHFR